MKPANRMHCVTVAALLSVLCADLPAGEPKADSDKAPGSKTAAAAKVEVLIKQLGADVYVEREAASTKLVEFGIAASPQLMEATKSPDAEIRHRASRILAVVIEADFITRLDEFAKDLDGKKDLSLPGWSRYRKRIGEDKTARSLFVQIQRSEPNLMQVYGENLKGAAKAAELRAMALQQQLRNPFGGRVQEITLGSVAALLVVTTDEDVSAAEQLNTQLYSLLHRTAFRQGIADPKYKNLLRKLLAAWIVVKGQANSASQYQKITLAMQHNIKEGIQPALAMIEQKGAPPYYRAYGMMAVAKFGDAEHIEKLAPLLKDETRFVQRKINKTKQVVVEIRDVALATMVHLSGQKLTDYGYKNVQNRPDYVINPQSLYFDDEKQRDAALEKWRKWEAEQASK